MTIPSNHPLQPDNIIVDGVVMFPSQIVSGLLHKDSNWDLPRLKQRLEICTKRLEKQDYQLTPYSDLLSAQRWLTERVKFVEKHHPALSKKTAVKPDLETLDLFEMVGVK